MARKLNLGSGIHRKEGYVNLDWNSENQPDVIHDLNIFPYPFQDQEFDVIEADHVMAYLERPLQVMIELHRLLKPGGTLTIKVPHFSRSSALATGWHGFDVTFPLYFNPNFRKSAFFGVAFELLDMRLRWANFYFFPFMGYGRGVEGFLRIANDIFSMFANISPELCSRVWCYWVGGFDEIEFTFKAVK